MSKREFIGRCPFFVGQMEDSKGLGGLYKKYYCLDRNENCAKHIVAVELGKENVPATLYPHQKDKAIQLLRKYR